MIGYGCPEFQRGVKKRLLIIQTDKYYILFCLTERCGRKRITDLNNGRFQQSLKKYLSMPFAMQ